MEYFSQAEGEMKESPRGRISVSKTPEPAPPTTLGLLATRSQSVGWQHRFGQPSYGYVPTAEVIQGMQRLARLELAQWNVNSHYSQQYLRDVDSVCDGLITSRVSS